jgi:hemerythrin
MKWSLEYSTGVEWIDEQHRALFRMSEDYREALDARQGDRVYGLMLESLALYARAHFGFEEQCMARYNCPVAEANAHAHKQFVGTVDRYRERFMSNGFDPLEARQLVDFIDQWLASHIARIDTQLKPCVEQAAGQ